MKSFRFHFLCTCSIFSLTFYFSFLIYLLCSVMRCWLCDLLALWEWAFHDERAFGVVCGAYRWCMRWPHHRTDCAEELWAETARKSPLVDRTRHLLCLHNLRGDFQPRQWRRWVCDNERWQWFSDDTEVWLELLIWQFFCFLQEWRNEATLTHSDNLHNDTKNHRRKSKRVDSGKT